MIIPHSRPMVGAVEARAVASVIGSSLLAQSEKVMEFERMFAEFIGVKGAVAVNSGTAALHLALLGLGIGRGDEVIVPSFVCTALVNAVRYTGADVRVVDVVEQDGNISPEATAGAINKKTKAIIVPHMFGYPADLRDLLALGVPIIEDCAHSVGAKYASRIVGSFGILSVFSFYATKMMTTGEGGMVVSNNVNLLKKIKGLREYDNNKRYALRYNYKTTDFQAAMGIVQLRKLPDMILKRKRIASLYNKGLEDCPISLPLETKGTSPVYYRYVIKSRRKNAFIDYLRQRGICCASPVFIPLHKYVNQDRCPVTERLMREAVSIPIYPSLKRSQVNIVIDTIRGFYGRS